MENLIASMSLIVRENNKEYPVEISIGKPHAFTEEEWVCPVSITPWKWQLVAARGINSFQALSLATSSVIQALQQFKEEGGILFMEKEYELPLEAFSATLAFYSGEDWFKKYPPKR